LTVIDIAAVDDHPIILDSVASWVSASGDDIRVVGTADTVAGLLAGPGRRAHVVLLDLDLGDGTTVERNVAAIGAAGPAVLVLSASSRPLAVRDAMRAGALGYVLKNEPTSAIRAAITEVAAGRDWVSPSLAYIFATDDAPDRPALSEQERRALQLYATGMPLKSVARKMMISDETVKQYLRRARLKYANAGRAAPTKLELYHRAVEDGHIPWGLLSSRSHRDCYHRAVEDGRIPTSS
jgi:two-component system, NarL family, nitrate/nitrite response regulator NarL